MIVPKGIKKREIYHNKKAKDEITNRKDAETKGRHIKEANKEKKSA